MTTNSPLATNLPFEDDDNEDELECRVCRGPAEHDRDLYTPCKCSGSIALVHQDCLTSWLAVTRNNKCELCSVSFKFAPRYADGAPHQLPPVEVITGVLKRVAGKWLPFFLRVSLAAMLWLCALPLITAYMYRGMIHRSSVVMARLKWGFIVGDAISGVIIAAVIIISFLSLMSFADFLRFHWQELDQQNEAEVGHVAAGNAPVGNVPAGNEDDGDVDVLPPPIFQNAGMVQPLLDPVGMEPTGPKGEPLPIIGPLPVVARHPHIQLNRNLENPVNNGGDDMMDVRNLARNNAEAAHGQIQPGPAGENLEDEALDIVLPLAPPPQPVPVPNPQRFEPRFEPLDPIGDQDDDMNMEIHVALDELLGFRGPIAALIRNLMWLVAFNTTYLGIFAFVPYMVGSSVYASLIKSNIATVLHSYTNTSFVYVGIENVLTKLNEESQSRNASLQLPDLATIVLGYLSMAFIIFLWKVLASGAIALWKKERRKAAKENEEDADIGLAHPVDPIQFRDDEPDVNLDNEHQASLGHYFSTILECAFAIVKIGVLLFLKMLVLPLLLGILLDVATLSLFDKLVDDRVTYAGMDLFGSALLHWVVGITFMLLVTVSVLQLREVVHPDILAKIIRPQEPQPDLLGNLLQDSGLVHAKRMFLSLGIYVVLLSLHIWLPSKLLVMMGLNNYLPFFRPMMFHILPQLQIPVELLIFHLSMLACLEKYKNQIGNAQHHFLSFICNKMGITAYLLPRSVEKFQLIGVHPIYLQKSEDEDYHQCEDLEDVRDETSESSMGSCSDCLKELNDTTPPHIPSHPRRTVPQVDPFWKDLSVMKNPCPEFIQSRIQSFDKNSLLITEAGVTKRDGQRVLRNSYSSIRLPSSSPTGVPISLPSAIGAYRLRRHSSDFQNSPSDALVIEFWQEVPGQTISRPPEGWDEFGVGGAEVQGRWAWGQEKCSEIERGVANRLSFDQCKDYSLIFKVLMLIVLSWMGVSIFVCLVINAPLLLGRAVFYLLKVPEKYVHDALGFIVGVCILYPITMTLSELFRSVGIGNLRTAIKSWRSSFHLPQSNEKVKVIVKGLLLWLIICPLEIGIVFDFFVVSPQTWLTGQVLLNLVKAWGTGLMFLHVWATMCYFEVFTKRFWSRIGMENDDNVRNEIGGLDVPVPDVANVNGDVVGKRQWQGEHGRIGGFVKLMSRVIGNWEWDKVDHVPILKEITEPLARQLLILLLVPLTASSMICPLISLCANGRNGFGSEVPYLGLVQSRLCQLLIFRTFSFIIMTIQLTLTFQTPLEHWFNAAHKAARDDRYLIGEVLLNYCRRKKTGNDNTR